MTDLTEQWKKGELPSGEYYIINDLGLHTTDRYYPSHGFGAELPQAVLAEVPDYIEWRNMVNCACEEHEANKRLIEENAQLKELLKECIPYFNALVEKRLKLEYIPQVYELLTKIDEVLR